MKNNSFHTHDVKRVCESKLSVVFRPGGEFNGWVIYEGRKIARITIPKGRKPIPPGTYRSMAGQLRLSPADFDLLLECPLTREMYFAKILPMIQ